MRNFYRFLAATMALSVPSAAFAGTETVPAPPARRRAPEPPSNPAAGVTADAVYRPPVIKAYPVGRYVDPSNPGVLHERHVVYRRETSGGWVLHAPQRQQVIVGPVLSAGPNRDRPLILRQETAAEIARLRAHADRLEEEHRKFLAAQGVMTNAADRLREEAERQSAVPGQLRSLRARIEALEAAGNPSPRPIAPPPAPPAGGSSPK